MGLTWLVRKFSGTVFLTEEKVNNFQQVSEGYLIQKPTLFTVPENAELFISFPIKAAIWVGGKSRIVISPVKNGKYELFLKNGTVSAMLDPHTDRANLPKLLIRTRTGVAEATGTFYAVTEYKGQAYTAVKKGTVDKKTTPPAKPDFSAYLKKAKAKTDIGKSARN